MRENTCGRQCSFLVRNTGWLFGIFSALAIPLLYWLGYTAEQLVDGFSLVICLLPVCAGMIALLVLSLRGKLCNRHFLCVIMVVALAIRVYYILSTSYTERQHDTFSFDSAGHLGYVHSIMTGGTLPQSNAGLFYHPPLHHAILALFGAVCTRLGATLAQAAELMQLVTCWYSLMCAWVFYRILEHFRLRGIPLVLGTALFALHPSFIIFSGSLNNDILCILLSMSCILYLLRWVESKTLGDILKMAASLGCAMMTKVSAVTIAPIIAAVFLVQLYKAWRKGENVRALFGKMLAFGALSIPLGVWYPIRNLIKFAQPLNYVMRISNEHPLYCGDRSFIERFVALPLDELASTPYCLPEEDYNINLYTLRCSIFGEFTFDFPPLLAVVLILLGALLIVAAFASAVYLLVSSKKQQLHYVLILAGINLISWGSFISFNLSYPHGCTMDFRYIVLCLVSGAALLTLALDKLAQRKPIIAAAGFMLIGMFCTLSSILYYNV